MLIGQLAKDWKEGKHLSVIDRILAKRPKDAVGFALKVYQELGEGTEGRKFFWYFTKSIDKS